MKITPPLFEAFLKCPTKCWLRANGEPPSGNTYAEWVQAQNESFRATQTERLLVATPPGESARAPSLEDLKTSKWRLAVDLPVETSEPLPPRNRLQQAQPPSAQPSTSISQRPIQSLVTSAATKQADATPAAFTGETRLHAVERVPSEGRGKAAQFIPIRFVFFNKLGKDDRLLLAFDAFVLGAALGREIAAGKIIHGDDQATLKVNTSALAGEVRKRLERIAALLSSPAPPDLVLNRHCAECEFQARCRQKALEKDDLSLLAGMSEKERKTLRSKGIFTVTQLSYTFRPRRRPKKLRDKREKYHHSLKALAIREKKIHIVGSPELKIEGTPVYLDVEGLPDRDFYYLIGLRIGNGESAVQHSLWADTIADEGKIWREFLGILETIEKPVLIHYGSYETTFLKRMGERHGGLTEKSSVAGTIGLTLNLCSFLFAQIYFPTLSNGLKEIARGLGCEWSETGASGLTSIVWRQQWEGSRSGQLMQKLITYNAQDCAALDRLEKRLVELLSKGLGGKVNSFADVVLTDSLPRNLPSIFKANQFHFAEFEQINKAAYWDYQREKVLVRSSENLKAMARQAAKRMRIRTHVNKIVHWPVPTACPKCGGPKLYRNQAVRKTVIDVRFGSGSAKRWVTMYRSHYCRCPSCRVFYDPERAWSREKFGPGLQAFCVYLNIELRLPQHQITTFLNQVLGFQLSCANVNNFKRSAAAFYQETSDGLLESIVSGSLVHADETKVSLRRQDGYVWVFTNLEEVVYLYSPSREAELVQRVLKDFDGVLVSDFYAAYDSLTCAQQKCLIHLIRDLNEDLFKEPFNGEFKELVGEVAALLKPMIDTVDQLGLKTRFLRRHKADVNRFFKRLSRRECRSEAAMKCRQRLEKNRDTLFTFLDHDGVPWNNNNAEHAVKAFALLRRNFDGLSTEKGIREYLILLSVCETCKFKGLSFLDFLRSGEKDIYAFAESRRGRRRESTTSKPQAVPPTEPVKK